MWLLQQFREITDCLALSAEEVRFHLPHQHGATPPFVYRSAKIEDGFRQSLALFNNLNMLTPRYISEKRGEIHASGLFVIFKNLTGLVKFFDSSTIRRKQFLTKLVKFPASFSSKLNKFLGIEQIPTFHRPQIICTKTFFPGKTILQVQTQLFHNARTPCFLGLAYDEIAPGLPVP